LKAVEALLDSGDKAAKIEKIKSLIADEQKEFEEEEKKEIEPIEKWCSENGLLGKEKLIKETLAIMNITKDFLKKEEFEAENPQIVQLVKDTEDTMLHYFKTVKDKNKFLIKDLFAKCLAERKNELEELMKSDSSIYQRIYLRKSLPELGYGDYSVQKEVYFADKLLSIINTVEEYVKNMK
jgi:hypothetical protein